MPNPGQFAVMCLAHPTATLIRADAKTDWYDNEANALAEASRAARDNPDSRFGVVKIIAWAESKSQRKGA